MVWEFFHYIEFITIQSFSYFMQHNLKGAMRFLVLKFVCYTTFAVLLVLAVITSFYRRRFAIHFKWPQRDFYFLDFCFHKVTQLSYNEKFISFLFKAFYYIRLVNPIGEYSYVYFTRVIFKQIEVAYLLCG